MILEKNIITPDNVLTINPNIHCKSKLSRKEFLERISNVKYLRASCADQS